MNRLILSILFIFMANPAMADSFTVQLSPGVTIAKVRSTFPKLKIVPLFSVVEQKMLQKLNRNALSQTLLIGRVPSADAIGFIERFTFLFPKVKIEKNDAISFSQIAKPDEKPDPLLSAQWAMKNTGQEVRVDLDDLRTVGLKTVVGEDLALPDANVLKNLKPVVVAVLDTGLDITHPDLKPVLRWKEAECEALTQYLDCMNAFATATPAVFGAEAENKCIAQVKEIDRDQNGYPMDCVGWSVTSSLSTDEKSPLSQVLGTPDMDDLLGHGTHVSGVIGAQRNNGIGISGVASNVKILPVRVIDTPPVSPLRPQSIDSPVPNPTEQSLKLGKSSVELIARGLLYAITEKVQVINMSLGWPATINSDVIASMIKLAEEQGIAVVAAAGNDSTDSLVLPCSFSGVICVGSYGPDGKRAPYSNRGPGVDLLAPGTSILSTYPLALRARFFTDLQGYELMSGTSMAAPMVSGSLAVLLGKGFSLDESLARLIGGARFDGSPVGENLRIDLGHSLSMQPRPLVRVVERAPIRLSWKERNETLMGTFHAKNLWKNITNCSVSYRVEAALNTVTEETLLKTIATSTTTTRCGAWKTGEEKVFSFPIDILGLRANRDFILNADLTYTSEAGKLFKQTIQVGVQVLPTLNLLSDLLEFQNSNIHGKQAGDGTMVRTLLAADARSTFAKPEYLVFSRIKEGIAVQTLSAGSSAVYEYSSVQKLTDLSWSFLVGQRYYSHEAKATRVALLYRKTSEISGLTQIRFEIFDEKLENLIRIFTYDGSFAPLPENFRWTSLKGKDAILFISTGKEPPSSDVWHQVPELTVSLRCYLLDAEGALSEIKVDTNDRETRIVDLLPLLAEDTDRDENALLVIRGKDYFLNYLIGHFSDGKVQTLQPFEINPYRNLGFLSSSPLLTEEGPATGNVLSSSVGRGKMRSTVLIRSSYNLISNDDFRFAPIAATDGVSRIVGGFKLVGKDSFFSQTNWDLQFHEFSGNEESVVKTSMNRFSFLPSLVSQRAFFPILIRNEDHQPEASLLTADIGSGFFNLSTLVPERNSAGTVVGVLRPAILSFDQGDSNCSFIGNPVWDAIQKVHRMNSFCGDSIRSIPLHLPNFAAKKFAGSL
jgi:subtilisin family serine protease